MKQKGIVDGHRARKRFGQNFLEDEHIIDQILQVIAPNPDDHMLEIGPGMGAITGRLLEQVNHLNVIELDRDLIPYLIAKFEHTGKLTIHQADALKFDLHELQKTGLRIVGNLPYNISTPLIFRLLEFAPIIRDMHFMLQKEVVNRLSAGVGDKAYGRLGIMVQYYCEVTPLLEVPPEAFNPPPKVDSGIVRLKPYEQLPYRANDMALLRSIVTQAFNQRRKTLRNSLSDYASTEQLEQAGIDPSLRPEKVSLEDFVRLTNQLVIS